MTPLRLLLALGTAATILAADPPPADPVEGKWWGQIVAPHETAAFGLEFKRNAAGDITVALPDEGSVEWEIVAGAGSTALVTDDSPTGDVERRIPRDGGYSESGETERMLTLEVISGAGDILFTTETPEGLDR